jgi:pyrimidine operon attenuation protein / uracil phosphoribosyltransferase
MSKIIFVHQILNSTEIQFKINRLAIEILERNYSEQSIILAGINNNGYAFAKLLFEAISQHDSLKNTQLAQIKLNPAKPLDSEITIDISVRDAQDKVVIVIDDVANTGRTLFYALKPFLNILPQKIEVAVLVDRSHKAFPVQPDYFGMMLSTTLQEHVEVVLDKGNEGAWLK